ncbi:uncharacterized protein LOC62_04G006445 [Vanrija pseudolonga]|uniref:Uncharacterized protein n=1 Tax=Vanrija pseudolonga TaxID=143232 RepID=A0AAF0YED1_9TREE|nr:hypothetical protein LOC62_04G006445 [Vanrija pseudolonga]
MSGLYAHAREIAHIQRTRPNDPAAASSTGHYTIHAKDFAPTAIAHPKFEGTWLTSHTARITEPTLVAYRPAPCTLPHHKRCHRATGKPRHSALRVKCDRCDIDEDNFLFGYDEFTVVPISPLPTPPPSPARKPLPALPSPTAGVHKALPPPPPLSFRSRQAYDMVQRENDLKCRLYQLNEFGY